MARSTIFNPLFIFIIAIAGILSSCSTTSSLADKKNYADDNDAYRKLYAVKFDENEKPLRYGYYYIVTKVPEGYKVRVFHPEKKMLTEDKIYSTPALTLLHGFYKGWWDDGSIREQGSYQYGRKNGIWLHHEPGQGKSSSGEYINDRKEGIWTQLDSFGVIESVYNYKDGKRYGKYFLYDASGQKTNEGLYRNDTLIAELFKLPVITLPYLKTCTKEQGVTLSACTESGLAQYVYSTIKYPTGAKKQHIEGSAFVQWDVMEDGSVQNLRLPQALSDDIEAEAKRVLRNMPAWEPARKDGVPIKWTVSIPVNFRL
ncbi:MAG TPA: TonB family protein [Saprospiraceae bacterium]|nr:TonB family protein [Saprospiraceae bacterium]